MFSFIKAVGPTRVITMLLLTPVVLMAFAFPSGKAGAQTNEEFQQQIADLMQIIAQLQAQLATLRGDRPIYDENADGADDHTGEPVGSGSGACLIITDSLYRGLNDLRTNGEVSKVQQFLTTTGDYTYPRITGYYGPSTEAAVKRWQARNGVVSFGTPRTTGYGVVGAETRAALTAGCEAPTQENRIKITSPNGGEKWQTRQVNTITWTPYSYDPDINPADDVTAYLEKKVRGRYQTVGKLMENGKASIHTHFEIDRYGNYAESGDYYVRIVNNETGAWDRSDRPFTLKNEVPKNEVRVTAPNGGEAFELGEKYRIKWSGPRNGEYVIYVEDKDGYGAGSVVRGTVDGNAVSWKAGEVYIQSDRGWMKETLEPGAYSIRVNEISTGVGYSDVSDDTFELLGDREEAMVRVDTPNGGEEIDPTKRMLIGWTVDNVDTVSVALYKDDKWLAWIEKDQATGGDGKNTTLWTPTEEIIEKSGTAENLKIYITGRRDDGAGYVDDKSDRPFAFADMSRTAEIDVELSDSDAEVVWRESNGSYGVFTLEFEVTARGADSYIPVTTSLGRNDSHGVSYSVVAVDGGKDAVGGSVTAVLASTAEKDAEYFLVQAGETETFTLEVRYSPANSDTYKLQMYTIGYSDNVGTPDSIHEVDVREFNTSSILLTSFADGLNSGESGGSGGVLGASTSNEEILKQIQELLKIVMQLQAQLAEMRASESTQDATELDLEDNEIITKKEYKEIVITSPADGHRVKRGTQLSWTWGWNDRRSDEVDIYIKGGGYTWEMAEDYPNNGSFWWNAGANSDWDKDVPNGTYDMIVCPSNKKVDSDYCDSFEFTMYGDASVVELLGPQEKSAFEPGQTITAIVASILEGDRYEFRIEDLSTVTGEIVLEKEFEAEADGKSSYDIIIPDSLDDGLYYLRVIQRTNDGVSCTNYACAQEGVTIVIES